MFWGFRLALILYSLMIAQVVAAADKVIVVHARGAAFWQVAEHLQTCATSNFLCDAHARGEVRPLTPIDNAVTISNIASFETGTVPSVHGIIGHTFGERENNFSGPVSGFSKTFAVETFWEKAAARGQKVLNIGALITHGQRREHKNVDVWSQGRQLTSPQLIKMDRDQAQITLGGSIHISFERVGELILVENNTEGQAASLGELSQGAWLEINVGEFAGRIATARIKWMLDGQIYVRGLFINQGAPALFLDDIDRTVGGSTGWPNISMFSNGTIIVDSLVEEIGYELDRVMQVFAYAPTRKNYDLILLDYPAMDRYGHAMLALSKYGEAYETAPYKALFSAGFKRMSRDFAIISEYAENNGYELLIASGHGFSPIHTSVNLNAVLEQGGLQLGDDWQARGMPGKVSGQIYVNANTEQEREATIQKVKQAFLGLRDPENGVPIVDEVIVGAELKKLGLHHARSGDVVVMLKPGYIFQPQFNSNRPVFDAPVFKGDHGYASHHPESKGVVISRNPNLRHVTDIAGYIDATLTGTHR